MKGSFEYELLDHANNTLLENTCAEEQPDIQGVANVPIDWMAAPVHTLRGRQVMNFLTG